MMSVDFWRNLCFRMRHCEYQRCVR